MLTRWNMFVVAFFLLCLLLLLASPIFSSLDRNKNANGGGVSLDNTVASTVYLRECLRVLEKQSILLRMRVGVAWNDTVDNMLGYGLGTLYQSLAKRSAVTREVLQGVRRVLAAYQSYQREYLTFPDTLLLSNTNSTSSDGLFWGTLTPTLSCDVEERVCRTYVCHPESLGTGVAVALGEGSSSWGSCISRRFPTRIRDVLSYAYASGSSSSSGGGDGLVGIVGKATTILRIDVDGDEYKTLPQWFRSHVETPLLRVTQIQMNFHKPNNSADAHRVFLGLYALGFAPVSYERNYQSPCCYEYTFVNITWFVDTVGSVV
eukprot:PhF_6_TR413/c0_g1_i1/m.129